MSTQNIRRKIEESIKMESRTNDLYKLFSTKMSDTVATAAVEFVKGYVRRTPEIIDQVYTVASSKKVLDRFIPVFLAVERYWNEEYDFIPDSEGLSGICDDAYLSCCLVQKIADTTINKRTKLLDLDLSVSNATMRNIFTPDLAATLDATVNNVFQSTQFQTTLMQLLQNPLAAMGFTGLNLNNLAAVNPQMMAIQNHMRQFDELQRGRHDVFMGNLGSMAAEAGIDIGNLY